MEFKKALEVVTSTIRDDSEIWKVYKANIAIAFKDSYNRSNKKYKNKGDIHKIANNAADNFLINWVSNI